MNVPFGRSTWARPPELVVSVLPATTRGRLTIAAFVNTSGGASARDAEGALTRQLLGDGA